MKIHFLFFDPHSCTSAGSQAPNDVPNRQKKKIQPTLILLKLAWFKVKVLSREKEYITNKDILQLGKTAGSHCTTDTFSATCFSAIRKVSKSQSGNSGLN